MADSECSTASGSQCSCGQTHQVLSACSMHERATAQAFILRRLLLAEISGAQWLRPGKEDAVIALSGLLSWSWNAHTNLDDLFLRSFCICEFFKFICWFSTRRGCLIGNLFFQAFNKCLFLVSRLHARVNHLSLTDSRPGRVAKLVIYFGEPYRDVWFVCTA